MQYATSASAETALKQLHGKVRCQRYVVVVVMCMAYINQDVSILKLGTWWANGTAEVST